MSHYQGGRAGDPLLEFQRELISYKYNKQKGEGHRGGGNYPRKN